jgi:hypothetical protein
MFVFRFASPEEGDRFNFRKVILIYFLKYFFLHVACLRSVGFEVLTAVVKKSTIFCDITPCRPFKVNRHFDGTYRLHLHRRRISRARNQLEIRWQAEPTNLFPRNVGWLSTDYTALYPRREHTSCLWPFNDAGCFSGYVAFNNIATSQNFICQSTEITWCATNSILTCVATLRVENCVSDYS